MVIVQTVEKTLYDLLIHNSEPIISGRRDFKGTHHYRVYDPVYEKTYRFTSEDEVRIWLEQRYYRHFDNT